MTSGSEGEPPAVGSEYYDNSGYFQRGGAHLLDTGSAFQRYRTREVLRLCGPFDGLRVVDLGCGWGTISFALAPRAHEVVGVDFAETSIRLCRRRQEQEPHGNLRFLRADAGGTGLPSGAWDLVVAADLVEHLQPADTLRVYREARRLLAPGGRFVIWTPNPGHLLERLRRIGILRADPTHVDYKPLERVVAELQAVGFRVLVARHVPSHLPVLRTVERWTQRLIPFLRRRVAVVAEAPK